MEKNKKTISYEQLNLFDATKLFEERQKQAVEQTPSAQTGTLNIAQAIRDTISETLKKSALSRFQVAGEMSNLTGKEISKTMLDSWSAESREDHRFPLEYMPAFCKATNDMALLRLICGKCGGSYIEGQDALRLEYGRTIELEKKLARKKRAIKELLELS